MSGKIRTQNTLRPGSGQAGRIRRRQGYGGHRERRRKSRALTQDRVHRGGSLVGRASHRVHRVNLNQGKSAINARAAEARPLRNLGKMEDIIVPLIFVSIPLLGYFVLTAMPRSSGWSEIVASYPSPSSPGKQIRFLCSIWVNAFPLKAFTNVGGNDQGLYMSSFFPGFGSFFVPWSDVSVQEKGRHLFMVYELKFTKTGNIFIQISPLLANRLRNWAGDSWPVETASSRF